MTQSEIEDYIREFNDVQSAENFGYRFFFVGEDHLIPFVSIADSDNEYDSVSNLNRDGIFRINIGVGRETFQSLTQRFDSEAIDYTAVNSFLPHPDYSSQHFICILNPSGENAETTKTLIAEAYTLAAARLERKKLAREKSNSNTPDSQ